jgi:hypothetical protein
MTDEMDLAPVVRSWFRETLPPASRSSHVIEAAIRAARTVRQQRHPWPPLPLPAIDRPVSAFPARELVPVATPATNGRTRPKGSVVLSTLKFVIAGVIVVAFGGLLLSGILTTQDGEVPPAAVTESPSPTTNVDILPGVTLTVEEVGPGVQRVTSDGVRDLTSVEAVDIVAGYDDGMWLLREDEFLRLGSDGSHGWPTGSGPEDHLFEVAPDGTMWVIPAPYPVSPLDRGAGQRSTDGEQWTVQPCPAEYCAGFTVARDGTVWASWRDPSVPSDVAGPSRPRGVGGQWLVGHLGPTGWQALDGYAKEGPWFVGDEDAFSTKGYRRLFIPDTGDLYGFNLANEGLFRYEDGDWESISPTGFLNVDVGPDGTVWHDGGEDDAALYRFADGEWARWTPDDLPEVGIRFGWDNDDQLKVAPDGSVWFRHGGRWEDQWYCDGLARFDGETLDRFLPNQCISIDIAADGSVWVLAGEERLMTGHHEERKWVFADDATSDLYVITPEAVAATE